jgi:hypothetical protein
LEKLEKRHTRTLNRLQEAMNIFDFEVVYKKGSEMPADFLSRNIAVLSWDSQELAKEQDKDPLINAMKNFLLHKELPTDEKCKSLIKHFADECFLDNDIVWRRIKKRGEIDRVVILLPQTQIVNVLKDAHGHLLSGHDGLLKTKERISQCYYWPGMDKDIQDHLHSCHKCQIRKTNDTPSPTLLTPLPQPTEPNQRVHADLFGPLKISGNNKKYILCITDAFTKYVELAALDNKEAPTVGNAIFERWICRYGIPLDIITDQGKEFCNQLSDDLYKRLEMSHLHTSPHHPACNSQAEVANKTIAKYLSSVVSDNTLDWELYLAPLMLSYNTSFHRSVKNTPHYLTYGLEARLPSFMTTDIRRKFYGENASDEMIQRLLYARDVARRHNEESSDQYRKQYDKKATPHSYQPNQLVLLDEHSFLHKNTKLAPKWSGPHRILRLKGETNVELHLRNGKKLVVHVNRLKPYVVPKEENPESKQNESNKKTSKTINQPSPVDDDNTQPVVKTTVPDQGHNWLLNDSPFVLPPAGDIINDPPSEIVITEPVRKRGRPVKTTRVPPAPPTVTPHVEHRYPLRRLQPSLDYPDGLDQVPATETTETVVANDEVDLGLNPVKDLRKDSRKFRRRVPIRDPWTFGQRHYINSDDEDSRITPPALAVETPSSDSESDSSSDNDDDLWWDNAHGPDLVPEDDFHEEEGNLSSSASLPSSSGSSPAPVPEVLPEPYPSSASEEEDPPAQPRPAPVPAAVSSSTPLALQPSGARFDHLSQAPRAVRQQSKRVAFPSTVGVQLKSRSRSTAREIHGSLRSTRSASAHTAGPSTTHAKGSFGDFAAATLFGSSKSTAKTTAPSSSTSRTASTTSTEPSASSTDRVTRSRGPAEYTGLDERLRSSHRGKH